MGSFFGHIDEGMVFLLLSFWWMYNMFRDYHESLQTGEPFRSRISYVSTIGKRRLPLEIFVKTSFTFIAFCIEIVRNGSLSFVDENNHFRSLSNLQHMSIYGLFTVHGVTDMLDHFKVSPVMKEMKYITVAISFFWYGSGFYYHSSASTHKAPLENMIHRLPLTTIAVIMLMAIWEMRQREIILPQLIRVLGVLTLGTWFIHASFILYLPTPFPGNTPNPNWDRYEETNVHFMAALYGYHLIFNILLILLFYALFVSHRKLIGVAKRLLTRDVSHDKSMSAYEYHKLNGVLVDTTENVKLLNNVAEYHD